jgi:hypothetical protein
LNATVKVGDKVDVEVIVKVNVEYSAKACLKVGAEVRIAASSSPKAI